MSAENNYGWESIHCRGCSKDTDNPLQLFALGTMASFENYQYQPGQLLSVKCKLARLYSDKLLAFGPDSAVFKLDQSNMVMKIYPELPKADLILYQEEINRARKMYPKMMESKAGNFEIEYVPLTHVTESPYGHRCALGYAPFIPGLNFQKYVKDYYKKHDIDTAERIILFEDMLSALLTEFFWEKYKRTKGRVDYLYLHAENFSVDFDRRHISVTDLACKIPEFLDNLALR